MSNNDDPIHVQNGVGEAVRQTEPLHIRAGSQTPSGPACGEMGCGGRAPTGNQTQKKSLTQSLDPRHSIVKAHSRDQNTLPVQVLPFIAEKKNGQKNAPVLGAAPGAASTSNHPSSPAPYFLIPVLTIGYN